MNSRSTNVSSNCPLASTNHTPTLPLSDLTRSTIMPRGSDPEVNPAAAHQSKFRVVPKKSYSERMSETRAEIRRIVKEALSTYFSSHALVS